MAVNCIDWDSMPEYICLCDKHQSGTFSEKSKLNYRNVQKLSVLFPAKKVYNKCKLKKKKKYGYKVTAKII